MKPKIILSLLFFLITFYTQAQSVYAPLNPDYYHLIERYEIKSGKWANDLHTQVKPYLRKAIVPLAEEVLENSDNLSPQDRFNLNYLLNDNWEWSEKNQNTSSRPIFNTFYQNQSDFYHYRSDDFEVHISPVVSVNAGMEFNDTENTRPYTNTRGLEMRGMISKKIGFYTFVADNQILFPSYAIRYINQWDAVPNEGYYKRGVGEDKVDFLTARGYFTFTPIKNIQMQFGHDKNFIGNGLRSMVLSDFAANYTFLKINTNVWKINYQNIFAQMTADRLVNDGLYPKKFFAMHHLSVNLTDNFRIGIFESIVFARDTTATGDGGAFDFNYLNPIIFYRHVEQHLGSPDNATIGMDFQWNLWKRLSFYGQFFLDEFLLSEIRNNRGWRGNKFAGQFGLKYIDVANISNLDLQLEANFSRPYTYSHNFKYREYSHYKQPLAHPLGSNFYELVGIIRYQPFARWQFTAQGIFANFGSDENNSNWGGNIFLDNTTFEQEYGNKIAQGVENSLLFMSFSLSWQFKHNLFLDLNAWYRNQEIIDNSNTEYFAGAAIRWNIPKKLYDF